MCFWYQMARPPGIGPVNRAATSRQSVDWEASTSARPGCPMPVACR